MMSETLRSQLLEVYRDLNEGRLTQEEAGRRLLEIDPDHGPALLFEAGAREEAGDLDEAEKLMWKALERMPCRPLTYLSLFHLIGSRNSKDPRLLPLEILAFWKMANRDEIPSAEAELFGKLDAPGVDFKDPTTFGAIAYELEKDYDYHAEPPEAAEQLLPYRLLNDLQKDAEGGLTRELVRRILDHAPRCAPVWRWALRDWLERPEFVSDISAALMIALLGEISGPEVVEDLVELMDHADAGMFAHVHWAVWRLGRRFPDEVLGYLRSASGSARITQLCSIAEQMHLLPDTHGLATALTETLDRLPEFSDDPDAPHLLAIVANALMELGLDDEAGEVMRVHQHQLSAKGRRDFKRLIKDKDGYVPRLVWEGIDEFDIEQICVDLALTEEEKDEDEDDEQEGAGEAVAADQKPEPLADFPAVVRCLLDASHEWRTPGQLAEAFRLFFGHDPQPDREESGKENFVEWYIYDFRPSPSVTTITEEYLKRHGASMTPARRALLEALCVSKFGLREVLRVEEGSGVELRDVFTGEQLFVYDVSSSKSLVRWDCVMSRVFYFANCWWFAGNGFLVPRNLLERLMERVREGAQAAGNSPADYLRATSHKWGQAVAEMQKQQVRDLRVVNAEGDDLEFSSATYQVLDEERAVAGLAAASVFEETTSKRDPAGERYFGWLETAIAGPRRSYGHIEIHHGMLRLACNSRKRLAIGRQLVEKHAGQFLKHLTDQFQSIEEVKERALQGGRGTREREAAKPDDIPTAVKNELMLQWKARHYATWPNEPLPALQGQTPREAVRSEVGRHAVDELLRMMENDEERGRKRGEPAFDFASLRKELGL